MTSRRTWLLSLTIGACVTLSSIATSNAQTSGVPQRISYQGQILNASNQPENGTHTITVRYVTSGNQTVHTETFAGVPVTNGIFNITLGSATPFPASMDFNQQYFIALSIDGGQEMAPTPMVSAPYALNANRINGFSVSGTPSPNSLLVLDSAGQIPSSLLPAMGNGFRFINGIAAGDSLTLVAGNGITLTTDAQNRRITINNTSTGGGGAITGLTAGTGLVGGGTNGNLSLGIAPLGVTTALIADGAITGRKLDAFVAGEGLSQDQLGNLNVNVDNQTLRIENDRLTLGIISNGQIDSTIQQRISGVASPGNFVQSINQNGSVNTGTVNTDNTLVRSVVGNNLQLGLNTTNSNTFTAPQIFSGVTNNGLLNQNGATNFNGNVLSNVGAPTLGTDAANRAYVDNAINTLVLGNIVLSGDIVGPSNATQISSSGTTGDNIITAINNGTGVINPARLDNGITDAQVTDDLTINGGMIDNTAIGSTMASTGVFTTLTANDLMINTSSNFNGNVVGNVGTPVAGTDAANKDYVDNSITNTVLVGDVTGTPGANVIGTTATTGNNIITAINNGTTTINPGQIANGITDAQVNDDLTILGGMIDNTAIGATMPSTGIFTSLTTDDLTVTSNSDFSGNVISNVGTPVAGTDAANKSYVDINIATTALGGDVTGTPGANTISTGAATGNNIIAAINNGTTTINPAQIANGISDAQVDDNLTITGGMIDNTAIGATTASTGVFTTLTAADLVINGTSNFNGNVIGNIGTPVAGTDAATKDYVDNTISITALSGDVTGTPGATVIGSTATTGDNIIAAINNGTTTINPAQLANGVTDAQVNDDLTISGGTINNTAIGATTASTGAFTTLTASDLMVTTSADFNGNVVAGVSTPVVGTDAANKDYVDNNIATTALAGDVTGTPGATVIGTTAATGNNIISAINNGTTTINPVQIANGVTDAQVNDNLTINGGAIDNTAIGATTASTGVFTTLSANDLTVNTSSNFNGNVIGNVGTPVAGTDAATKAYVDNAVSGGGAGVFSTLTSSANSTIGTGASGVNSFGTGAGASNTIGNATGLTTVNGQLQVHNTTPVTGEVNTEYVTSVATGNRATGVVVEATSDVTGQSRPSANAVLGVAKWSGSANTTDQIVGVVGKAEPNNGITSIGVVGQATNSNTLSNTGVLGWSASGSSNVGVTGAVNASAAQLQALAGTSPTAAVYAYNASTTGTAITANAPQAGTALDVVGGSVRATAAASGSTSNRWADTYSYSGAATNLVTISNNLVDANSTIIITLENNVNSTTMPTYQVENVTTGSFDVRLSGSDLDSGDRIHYTIINH